MAPYNYQEFPRVVYGPEGKTKTIRTPDERPDGFFNTREEQLANYQDDSAKAREAAEAEKIREAVKGELDKEGVKYAANAHTPTLQKRLAEVKSEKAEMLKHLTEHNVDVPNDATHATLVDLSEQLGEYLTKQAEAAAEAEKTAASEAEKGETKKK